MKQNNISTEEELKKLGKILATQEAWRGYDVRDIGASAKNMCAFYPHFLEMCIRQNGFYGLPIREAVFVRLARSGANMPKEKALQETDIVLAERVLAFKEGAKELTANASMLAVSDTEASCYTTLERLSQHEANLRDVEGHLLEERKSTPARKISPVFDKLRFSEPTELTFMFAKPKNEVERVFTARLQELWNSDLAIPS